MKNLKKVIVWTILIVGFFWVCSKYRKHKYEEIHSPYIEEDGSTLKIERK